jgi:hypothetical protein
MHSGRRLLLATAAAAIAAGCLPLESDLDDYSRDWQPPVNGDVGTDTGTLQEDPPGDPPASGEGEVDGDGTATPGTDENPGDPTLSNPDPAGGDGSSGNETPPAEPPPTQPPEDPPPNPCPDGIANALGTTCYFVSTETASWAVARSACQAWGGDLVVMDAPFEDSFVSTLSTDSVWIGASDIAVDNTFVWVDGRPIGIGAFGNWGPAQPDAFPGADCIEKRQEDVNDRWYDRPCSAPFRYICEKPAAPAVAAQ